jgi:mono/diheme cytochrome c family protein
MKKNLKLIPCMMTLVIVFSLTMIACERSSKSIADKEVSSEVQMAKSDLVIHPAVHGVPDIAGISDVLPKNPKDVVLDGSSLFATHCAACHQVSGQGLPGVFPPLAGSSYVTSDNVERLAAIMIYGLMGPIKVNGVEYNSVMAGLGATLSDEELSAIAGYIRNEWGNSADPVPPEVYAETREKYGSRGPFTIEELGAEE